MGKLLKQSVPNRKDVLFSGSTLYWNSDYPERRMTRIWFCESRPSTVPKPTQQIPWCWCAGAGCRSCGRAIEGLVAKERREQRDRKQYPITIRFGKSFIYFFDSFRGSEVASTAVKALMFFVDCVKVKSLCRGVWDTSPCIFHLHTRWK
jgi:hypothetical protein